jgi:hypothetical protein
MSEQYQPSLEYLNTTGYVSDSDTSATHAQFEKQRAGKIQTLILETITEFGTNGATSPEVEQEIGMAHQTVSAAIRNMELDGYEQGVSRGKVTKLKTIRNGCHAYVATSLVISETSHIYRGMNEVEANLVGFVPESQVMEPNARRASWKKRLSEVVDEIESVIDYPEPFLANHLRGLIDEIRNEL